MPPRRRIRASKVPYLQFDREAYTPDEYLDFLERGEEFLQELVDGQLVEARKAIVKDVEEFIDKVFRNSSKRGTQAHTLSQGRFGPNRVKTSGRVGSYPSIDQPIRIDRLHGSDSLGGSSDVFVKELSDGEFEITVTNYVFNLLDQGRPAITGKTMLFPRYTGKRLQKDLVKLSSKRATLQAEEGNLLWVKTRRVGSVEPHNFLQTIINNRRLKGSNWSRQMRRYQLKAQRELEDFPYELSFRFDDSLMTVELV